MVDQERLARTLARVREDVARLRALAATRDLVGDEVALAAAKYAFVTAIEGCLRAALHVVSSEAFGVPATSAGAVRMLGAAGVVPSDLAEQVARAVGFRNVLVHEYAEVDDDAVRANVSLLGDLEGFTSALAAWAVRHG